MMPVSMDSCKIRTVQPALMFLLILVLASSAALAQQGKEVSVYLKSGDVVFGRVLSHDSLGNYRIMNDCGIRFLSLDEISRISRRNDRDQDEKPGSYYNQSTVALLFGEGSSGIQPKASITMVNGWQWSRRIYAGVGLGYEYYDRGVMPLFAEGKYFFSGSSFSPFLSFRIGYALPVEKRVQPDYYGLVTGTYGGVLLNPEAGVRLRINSHAAFIAGLGFNYQELSHRESYYSWSSYDRTVFTHYNRISFRIGFIFQ